jgi:hypothetical protein
MQLNVSQENFQHFWKAEVSSILTLGFVTPVERGNSEGKNV